MAQFQATTKSASAPNIEAQMYDMILTAVESKRVKGGKFTKDAENGDQKLEWLLKLLDDDGKVLRDDNEESENFGKPIILGKLTGIGFNIASTTTPAEVKMLKALLTNAEFKAFEAGEGTPDSSLPQDEGGLLGRKVQGEVFIKENGWPGIGNVIAARKPVKAKAPVADDE